MLRNKRGDKKKSKTIPWSGLAEKETRPSLKRSRPSQGQVHKKWDRVKIKTKKHQMLFQAKPIIQQVSFIHALHQRLGRFLEKGIPVLRMRKEKSTNIICTNSQLIPTSKTETNPSTNIYKSETSPDKYSKHLQTGLKSYSSVCQWHCHNNKDLMTHLNIRLYHLVFAVGSN